MNQDEARDIAIEEAITALDEVTKFVSLDELIGMYNEKGEDYQDDPYAWSAGFADNH